MITVWFPLRFNSSAMCRSAWFRAAFEAPYAAKPSSLARKRWVEPESLDMNVMAPISIEDLRRRWAQIIGPIVLV